MAGSLKTAGRSCAPQHAPHSTPSSEMFTELRGRWGASPRRRCSSALRSSAGSRSWSSRSKHCGLATVCTEQPRISEDPAAAVDVLRRYGIEVKAPPGRDWFGHQCPREFHRKRARAFVTPRSPGCGSASRVRRVGRQAARRRPVHVHRGMRAALARPRGLLHGRRDRGRHRRG